MAANSSRCRFEADGGPDSFKVYFTPLKLSEWSAGRWPPGRSFSTSKRIRVSCVDRSKLIITFQP